MNFFHGIFLTLILKVGYIMNLEIITRNHANPEIESFEIDFKAVWPRNSHADSMNVNAPL